MRHTRVRVRVRIIISLFQLVRCFIVKLLLFCIGYVVIDIHSFTIMIKTCS